MTSILYPTVNMKAYLLTFESSLGVYIDNRLDWFWGFQPLERAATPVRAISAKPKGRINSAKASIL